MSRHAFFDDAAKTAVRAAIQRVEGQTSAEIVVMVRKQAGGSYRETDLGFGAICAIASLALVLFVDKEFATTWIPLDVAMSFAVGALLCRYTFLRRILTSSKRKRDETRRAACEAFHDMRIGRCSGRNGILVLVGMFERKVAVIPDVAVDPKIISASIAKLGEAVDRSSPAFDSFIAALETFGPALAPSMPRRDDDVNELPDDMGVA